MAIYRTVSMSFWTDNKVADDFTPEDRYFYLYLFTNPHTNLCGCYEVSIKQMANELGYNKDSVENLIKRFEDVHNVLRFCKETKEILLLNWGRYNWTSSEKFRKPLEKEISNIKSYEFKEFLTDKFHNGYGIDTTCIHTTVTVTDINNIDITNNYINSNSNINTTNNKSYSFDNHSNIENLEYVNNEKGLNIHPLVYEIIYDWMEYKDQKKPKSVNHYGTEKGITTLITKFTKNCNEYGLDAVRHAVEESIANNYQGIVWEKAQQFRSGKGNYTYKPQQTTTDLDPQIAAQLRALEERQNETLAEFDNLTDEEIDRMCRGEL